MYVRASGLLSPRYNAATGYDAKGEYTLDSLSALNAYGVAAARKKATTRFFQATTAYVERGGDPADAGRLWDEVRTDTFGVACWFLAHDGQAEPEVSELRTALGSTAWRRLVSAACRL